jgi:hypothetical protein
LNVSSLDSILTAMETNRTRQITLQSGEALPADLPRGARVFLCEGTLRVQPAPEWLGDEVVFQAPRLILAPAALDRTDLHAGTALTGATLLVATRPGLPERLAAAFGRLRGAWQAAPQPARG